VSESPVETLVRGEYSAGFVTDIESETLPPGLDTDVVRFISARKNEPAWLTEWRLKAFHGWQAMTPPEWAHVHFPPIDYQAISYYSAPRSQADGPRSLDEVDPELLRTYEKLGIPLHEQAILAGVVSNPPATDPSLTAPDRAPDGELEPPARPLVAVDAVFDSVSIATTFKDKLAEAGVVFCAISEAVHTHPELIRKYLGSVVPMTDNYYAALNSAVFSDGSFVYVPEGVRCPMELSTYFRINARNTGQFERTLIIAERGAYVSYLEGCTAPMRDENQLHAAVVELVALEDAEIKYSTVQNWYPGDKEGKGGIYNFVTKRGVCVGDRAKISWTQVETGSAITWKYPSVVLRGNDSVGEFYSVALTNNRQQADTGTKMIHIGRNTRSTIVSKGISAGRSQNTYRGLVRTSPSAAGARNYTQCDSLLIGDACGAHTFPYIENRSSTAIIEHEASTSKVSEEQLFLCQQRGIDPEKAVSMIVNGFCRAVFRELPMEFAVEAGKLLEVSLEGAVG
jgi:Fe-S cluster assembly protein SufB